MKVKANFSVPFLFTFVNYFKATQTSYFTAIYFSMSLQKYGSSFHIIMKLSHLTNVTIVLWYVLIPVYILISLS